MMLFTLQAAQIVRTHVSNILFTGSFKESCELSATLAASTSKYVMEGPSLDQIRPSSTQAALSIAQILKYNSVKHMSKLRH